MTASVPVDTTHHQTEEVNGGRIELHQRAHQGPKHYLIPRKSGVKYGRYCVKTPTVEIPKFAVGYRKLNGRELKHQ